MTHLNDPVNDFHDYLKPSVTSSNHPDIAVIGILSTRENTTKETKKKKEKEKKKKRHLCETIKEKKVSKESKKKKNRSQQSLLLFIKIRYGRVPHARDILDCCAIVVMEEESLIDLLLPVLFSSFFPSLFPSCLPAQLNPF